MNLTIRALVLSQRGRLGLALLFSVCVAACDTGLAYIIKPVVDQTVGVADREAAIHLRPC